MSAFPMEPIFSNPLCPASALAEPDWHLRRTRHEERMCHWTDPHQERQRRGEKHPVYDFLFDYYAFRPSWLKRWHPGLGVELTGASASDYLRWPDYRATAAGVAAGTGRLSAARRESIEWIRDLLQIILQRPPHFACFGLHEWAMVYRLAPAEVRHRSLPLRLSRLEIDEVVENLPLCCTHFDAFRFFTPPAAPLNRTALTRGTVPAFEQGGCLHANMDVYKWAFKLSPLVSSDLLADCFELAREIREVDMRASPYDVSSFGLAAISVETPSGRLEYETAQRAFAQRAQVLRAQLLTVYEAVIATWKPPV